MITQPLTPHDAARIIARSVWAEFRTSDKEFNQSLEEISPETRALLIELLRDAGCTVIRQSNPYSRVRGMREYIIVRKPAKYKVEAPWK